MKKSILLAGALMLMMAACSNEEILPNEEVKNPAEPTLTIIVTQGEDADSRIAYIPSADGETISLTWTEGDVIYVCEAESPTKIIELTLTEGAGTNKGTFTTNEDLAWENGTKLMAYYKANEDMYIDNNDGRIFFYPVNYWLAQVQTADDGSMDHLKDMNHMQSETFTYTEKTVSSLQFSQMGAIMQLNLSGLDGKTIKELKLVLDDASKSLVQYESYFIENGSFMQDYSDKGYMSFATLTLGEGGAGIVADDNLTAYLMLGATELTENKNLTLFAVASDGSVYKASIKGGKLVAGEKYTLSKKMESFKFFSEGEGTAASPYMISTAQHLMDLDGYLNSGFYMEGVHFKLNNDIDLSSVCGTDKDNWIPIGEGGYNVDAEGNNLGFKGTFDGGGHTISKLYFNNNEELYVALFGCIAVGGTLKDLHLQGNITANMISGGLVAVNLGTVSGCTFVGSVTVSEYVVGGIVAENEGTVIGCSNSGTITLSGEGEVSDVGGIVGTMYDGSIKACYNTGTVSGNSGGGIVGNALYGNVIACYHTSGTPVVGSVVVENTVTVSNCYWASNTVTSAVGTGSATVTGGGQATDWSTAMTAMNTTLTGSGWKYEANTDETTKETEPLKLAKSSE